jgi:hypothetical protein
MERLGLLLGALATLAVAEDDPTDVLVRLRGQVTAHGQRIPNHTCVETIQRDHFLPRGTTPKSCDALLSQRNKSGAGPLLKAGTMDRLRLDVALSDGREIYSWPGAGTFLEGDGIFDLIRDGPIGTGPFASMVLDIFNPSSARFFYDGDTAPGGRRLMQYSFTVPREQSNYRARAGNAWWVTGYTGTVLVDPQTATPVRITIRTDELPPQTAACEVDTTLDYSTVQLGGLGYLLPNATHQRFISRDGSEVENSITFAACKEYKAESTLTFEEPASSASPPRPVVVLKATGWPTGLPVSVELTADMALDQAAAGDRIEGRLALPIRDPKQRKTLAPAGALMAGRLMLVETNYSIPRDITVSLRWETIDINGVKTTISLDPVRKSGGAPPVKVPRGLGGLRTKGIEVNLPRHDEARYAVFHFHGDQPVMKSGSRTDWVTGNP